MDDEDVEEEEEDDEEVPPAEARQARSWRRFLTAPLLRARAWLESFSLAAWATTGKSTFGLRAAYALLRGPYADVRKQLRKTPTEDNQCSFKKRHSNA